MKAVTTSLLTVAMILGCSAPFVMAGDAPVFAQHPQGVMVAIGDTLHLSGMATGSPPVSYIWRKDSTYLGDQTNAVLILTNVQPSDSGFYRLIASNNDGLVQSDPAEVIVYTNQPCNFPWVWKMNDPTYSRIEGVDRDSQGNIFVAGSVNLPNNDYDYLTVKLSPNGNELWRATYDDPTHNSDRALDLAVDSDGNCIVTGYSRTQEGDNDYLTLKYSPDGTPLWTNTQGNLGNDHGSQVVVDGSNNCYVSGNRGTFKYDPDGNPVWTNSASGWLMTFSTNDSSLVIAPGNNGDFVTKISTAGSNVWQMSGTDIKALAVDANGNTYVAGIHNSGGGDDQNDIVIVKVDSAGDVEWSRIWDSEFNRHERPSGIAVDTAGNVIITGVSHRVPISVSSGEADMVLLKYSPDGELVWTQRFNDSADQAEIPQAVATDSIGSIYVSGATEWEATGQQREAILWKYDANGNLLWTSRHRSLPIGTDYFNVLDVAEDGTVVAAGQGTFFTDWYFEEFLVAFYDQETPRLKMADVPAPGVRQGCLVSARWSVFDVLAKTNLMFGGWEQIGTVTNLNGLVPFFDSDAGEHPMRFYRARESSP